MHAASHSHVSHRIVVSLTLPSPCASYNTGTAPNLLAHIATFTPTSTVSPCLANLPSATESPLPSASPVPSSTKAMQHQPFILSKASPPVPGKLVSKIQSLQFVDMRELLPDNMALLERLSALPQGTAAHTATSSPKQRDIPSLTTWTCAFTTYVAVLAEARPDLTKSRLAYMRNIVREAGRFGGDGWKTYDYIFRSQAAADQSLDWSELNPSLMLAFFSCNNPWKTINLCTLCQEHDHPSKECALAPLATSSALLPATSNPKTTARQTPPAASQQICISWNQEACMLPGSCRYKHHCATCGHDHMARECWLTPEDSIYRRPPKRFARSSS